MGHAAELTFPTAFPLLFTRIQGPKYNKCADRKRALRDEAWSDQSDGVTGVAPVRWGFISGRAEAYGKMRG